MSRPAHWLPLLLLVIGNVGPLLSQVIPERPPTGTPTPVAAVASLTAGSSKNGIWLTWPPAAGTDGYWVTRVDNSIANPPEETISKGPATNFVFEGTDCRITATGKSDCTFVDAHLIRNHSYSYRVWTGGGPSPVAHGGKAMCSWSQAESKPKTNPPTYVWGCF